MYGFLQCITVTVNFLSNNCIFVREHASYFKRVSDSKIRVTRPNDKLCVPKCRLDLHKRNAYCMAIKVYNHLPNYIREITAHTVFKHKLRNWLLCNNFYTINEYLTKKNKCT